MMRVFVIAAASVDGLVARNEHELADWTSTEDKKMFVTLTKEAGVMVMGGNTYRTIGRALPGRRNIVYSRQPISQPGIETTQEDPVQLIRRLGAEGHSSVAICGGRAIWSMFLRANLVTDLYITIEPVLFGQGIGLSEEALDLTLKLVACKQLNESVLFVHYEVKHDVSFN
jgi:dihydrofolate reductase